MPSLLHPRPPIRDRFHPQSISDVPAPPGSIISDPTVSHQEGGDSLLGNFSVPISYPLSMTLRPTLKALEMDKADPPGVQEHGQDEAPPRLQLPSSAPGPLPCRGPARGRGGKHTAVRVGSVVRSSASLHSPYTTFQNPAAPVHIFKLI